MKKDTHPKFYEHAKVVCACGSTFEVGSTHEKIEVEICSACHPFFTGQEKVMDTAGRVEKFKTRMAKAKETTPATKVSKAAVKTSKKPIKN